MNAHNFGGETKKKNTISGGHIQTAGKRLLRELKGKVKGGKQNQGQKQNRLRTQKKKGESIRAETKHWGREPSN